MSNKSLQQEEINKLISLYKKGLLNEALLKVKKLSEHYPNYHLLHNIHGMINVDLKNLDQSLDCFYKAIKLNPEYAEAYNNLGITQNNLGRLEESIQSYTKAIELKPNYANAYNNLGSAQSDVGKWEEAIINYTKAIELKPDHPNAYDNLVKILTFYNPKTPNSNPCILASKKLRNLKYIYNSNKQIMDEDVKRFFQTSNKIIFENTKKIEFNASQIYRRNTIDLGCERHFKVFNTFNVIPEYCFGCYKVQVEPTTVMELFKLFFIFDKLKLAKNNTRKCFVEMRPDVSGIYKGLIYCFSFNEAKEIQSHLSNILNVTINKKIVTKVKRGCSEFAISYPEYNKIDKKKDQLMKYNKEWKEKEKIIDEKEQQRNRSNQKVVKDSLSGITLSDILIMRNWLIYAKKIGDLTYKNINEEISISPYMEKELSEQLPKRVKEFSSSFF